MDGLNTRQALRRKRILNAINETLCCLCTLRVEESTVHLFFDCPFSRSCWTLLGIHWSPNGSIPERLEALKATFRRSFFMDVIVMGAWTIWLTRNRSVFDGIAPLFPLGSCVSSLLSLLSRSVSHLRSRPI
ncbi:hypothetical protein GUJ93_ZPchr0239g7020 [Zizania palustris]|uniref:Reverse transcriptase zinc-binding domain-containing protein n=1 Tax=Zizania palustris TaxID=103762 RepID=A0A8J5V335_ZIZPA|nr:hypothetical protein GUJ93_ZPchr0239g7018 [Zizania palustris]KAG8044431.1 hypothetical protein GUJ93_ZPchr0239g7020 [Zizania palustris]